MREVFDEIFEAGAAVRYVAISLHGELEMKQRPGLADASAVESDRYEELLVNPTALTLFTRRGEIDCGGLAYLLVRYGRFFQLVQPLGGGHVSVSLEPTADLALVERLRAVIARITSAPAPRTNRQP